MLFFSSLIQNCPNLFSDDQLIPFWIHLFIILSWTVDGLYQCDKLKGFLCFCYRQHSDKIKTIYDDLPMKCKVYCDGLARIFLQPVIEAK